MTTAKITLNDIWKLYFNGISNVEFVAYCSMMACLPFIKIIKLENLYYKKIVSKNFILMEFPMWSLLYIVVRWHVCLPSIWKFHILWIYRECYHKNEFLRLYVHLWEVLSYSRKFSTTFWIICKFILFPSKSGWMSKILWIKI